MNNKEDLPSLEELDKKIKEVKSKNSDSSGGNQHAMSSTKVSLELFSGVLVGTGMGYYIDKWLDTMPLFLIILFFFGVAAGALNIYKLIEKQTDDSGD